LTGAGMTSKYVIALYELVRLRANMGGWRM
jgi:hypothetical protein